MKNTVRKVRLEGELGEKFGEVWNLNVQTPHEAIRAIECQTKGFRKHIVDNAEKGIGYEVLIGDQGIKQEEELLYPAPMRDDFTIIPIIQGAKSRGFGMILFGIAMMIPGIREMTLAMAPTTGPATATTASGWVVGGGTTTTAGMTMSQAFGSLGTWQSLGMTMGASLVFGGASLLLAPSIDGSGGDEEQSYLFDGAINSTKQGTPVPILYGRLIVGGAVISASIKSNQETAGITGTGRKYVVGFNSGGGWIGAGGKQGAPSLIDMV